MARKALRVIDVTEAAQAEHGVLSEVAGTLAGMEVTLRNLVRGPAHRHSVTIRYPEQRRRYSRRFRGVHVLTRRADGSLKCTACFLCETVCPAQCIHIEATESEDPRVEKVPSRYEIDLARCIFCGFCVEACPEEALLMSREYDLATFSRDPQALTYGIRKLTERPEIAMYGAGFRPHMQYPLVESYMPGDETTTSE